MLSSGTVRSLSTYEGTAVLSILFSRFYQHFPCLLGFSPSRSFLSHLFRGIYTILEPIYSSSSSTDTTVRYIEIAVLRCCQFFHDGIWDCRFTLAIFYLMEFGICRFTLAIFYDGIWDLPFYLALSGKLFGTYHIASRTQ